MGSGKAGGDQTIGYRYFMTLQMGLARGPIDEVVEVMVGGTRVWPIAEGESFKGKYNLTNNYIADNTSQVKTVALGPDDKASLQFADGESKVVDRDEIATARFTKVNFPVDAGEVFGGDSKEGGIKGFMHVFMGDNDLDVRNTFDFYGLQGLIPGMRGVATILYDGLISSMNPYPKKWSFRIRRTTKGWQNDQVWNRSMATIWMNNGQIMGMNGAHIIYEALTNKAWGRGWPTTLLHDESFRIAASVMFDEGLGLCMKYNRTTSIGDLVATVLDHIGGSLYTDPVSGQVGLKLLRDDYVPTDLPLYGYDSGLLAINQDEVLVSDEAVNEVVVKWRDPLTNQDRESRIQNLASIQINNGEIFTTTKTYKGISTEELALRVAQRDLRVATSSNKRFTIELDRRANTLVVGDVIRITAPELGLYDVIVRIGKLSVGAGNKGQITATCVIDVFGLKYSSFGKNQPPQSGRFNRIPPAIKDYIVREATWGEMIRTVDPANLALLTGETGYIATLAQKPSPLSLGYHIGSHEDPEQIKFRTGTASFCAVGYLGDFLDWDERSINLVDCSDLGLVHDGMQVQIGDEICDLVSFTADGDTMEQMVVNRGCSDTLPLKHDQGTPVYLYDMESLGRDAIEYGRTELIDVKLASFTTRNSFNLEDAPSDEVFIRGRQGRAWAPGRLRINGIDHHNIGRLSYSEDLQVTWIHRNRLIIKDQMLPWNKGTSTIEPNTSYKLRFFSGNNLVRSILDYTGTSYTYTEEDQIADGFTGDCFIELEAQDSDGINSNFKYRVPIDIFHL